MQRAIQYGTERIPYEVCFLPTRTTLGIEVHPDSRVLVRAPEGCSETLIRERVHKRAAWISRQLAEFERYRPRTPPRHYVNGESHLYLGRQYRLKLSAASTGSVKASRGFLSVAVPGGADPDKVKSLLHRWLLDRARTTFSEVLDSSLARCKAGVRPRLIVRAMQTRWGSLSKGGTMTLNASLIQAPRPCIEYVVIHELCHLQHRNHDARFFKLLGQLMPDWEQRKRRLEQALF